MPRPTVRLGEAIRVTVPAYLYGCLRCQHVGLYVIDSLTKQDAPPERCAACKSPYWHVAKGVLPRGRRKKKSE